MARAGSVFLVNLAGLDLPEATLNAIEKDIDQAVDRHIAGVAKLKGQVASVPLGPHIRGKYIMPKAVASAFGTEVRNG